MIAVNIRETIRRYRRILQIARKPGKEEFLTSTKVCALGMVLIGFIGFFIFLAFVLGLPGA
jgi:protein transport protein SEC61 subunit gamma-like protein